VGATVGSYRIVRCLDTSGTGAVYLGEHPEILSKVAIKILAPELAAETDVVKRFLDEARAQNRIGHPGIVPINDCDTQEGAGLFLVMEFVEGRTLADELQEEGRLTPQRIADIARQAASALGAAHAAGIVHRKLKPSNIIMAPDPDLPAGERVRIFGFGIAKLVEESETLDEATKTGIALGFPRYISPEQCLDAKSVDHRTDVYSLGAICYEVLCGRPPYEAQTFGHMVIRQETTEPPAPRTLQPDIPAALEEVVVKAISKDPAHRYQDMKALRAALDRAVPQGKARPAPRPPKPKKAPPPKPEETPVARATAILDPGDGGDPKDTPLSQERETAILDPGVHAVPDRETVILDDESDHAQVEEQDTIIESGEAESRSLADQETPIQRPDGEETLIDPGASLADQQTLIQRDDVSLGEQETMIKGSLADQQTMLKGGEGLAEAETIIKGREARETGAIRAREVPARKSKTGLLVVLVAVVVLGLAAAWFFANRPTPPPDTPPVVPPAPVAPAPLPVPPEPAAGAEKDPDPAPPEPAATTPDSGTTAAPGPDTGPAPDTRPAPATPESKKGKPKKKRRPKKKKGKKGKKGPYFRDL